MTLKHFIDRPVLAAVISIVIVLGGIIGVATLPVEQYPDIAPPTVMVRASYPGASAETIQKSVIIPLEEAINGVENMMYIKSEASNAGSGSITVYFKQGTNADMAAVNVQNKVATATGSLPAEVTKIGVTTMKRQSSMLKVFTLSSPDDSYDENFLSNYLNINIKPRIQRIQGVGEFFALGGDYAMRIWMKPDVMAQYKLIPSDITGVLAEQNIESAAGMFGENSDNTFQYTMKYRGRKMTPEEFGEIVIRATSDGQVLRLKDVADIELGQDSYAYHGMVNGHPGVSALVFQTAGTNATQTVEEIDAMLDEIATELPKGVEITHLMSVNDYLYASIHEVIKTLIEAIILVILVVYVFLQDIRSTLIPTISILVSLVGTFAFLSFAGFSINLLTLFALVRHRYGGGRRDHRRRSRPGTLRQRLQVIVPGYGRCHGRHHFGHHHLDAGLHGRVYPGVDDGRNLRYVLYAIRYHDGRRRRYLRTQRTDSFPGALRPVAQTLCR